MTGHLSPGDPPETSQRGPREKAHKRSRRRAARTARGRCRHERGLLGRGSTARTDAETRLLRSDRRSGGAASSSATEPSRKRLVRLGTRKPLDATNGSTGGRSPPEAPSQPMRGGSGCTTRRTTSTAVATAYASGRTRTPMANTSGVDAAAHGGRVLLEAQPPARA